MSNDSGRLLANYHTHTWRCMHARGTEEEYVRRAIDAGISVLGFSDHSPWPYTSGFVSGMRMRWDQFPGYLDTVLALREKYAGQIKILTGLECEAFPAWFGWLRDLKAQCLDYVLMGNHYDSTDEGDHNLFSDRGGFYFGRCTRPEHVRRYVRRTIAGIYGQEIADKVRIQYGGSMKGSNVKGLMAQPEIDGGLIGGASLKAEDFAQVVNF